MADVPASHPAKRLSRRQLLIAAAIGTGAVAGGGTAAYLATRGSGNEPAPAAATPPPPTTMPSPPTPTPAPDEGEIVSRLPDAFERRAFASDELIDWPSGVFFMDVNTGAVTGYRLPSDESRWISVAGEGRFVVADGGGSYPAFLLDRTTGTCWNWDGEEWWLVAGGRTKFVFGRIGDGSAALNEPTQFAVVDVATGAFRTIMLPLQGFFRWLTQGDMAAVLADEESGALEFINLESGERRTVKVAEPDREGQHLVHISFAREASGIQVVAGYETVSGPVIGAAANSVVHVESPPKSAEPFESRSPDGRFALRQQLLFDRPVYGEGGKEQWPAAVLVDGAENPIFRIRSASLPYGDQLPDNRWLADSSAFVVGLHAPDMPGAGLNAYALVSLSGEMTLLPQFPSTGLEGYVRWRNPVPVPSPTNPDLLSFGSFTLYNLRSQKWFIPNVRNNGGAAHLRPEDSPWVAGPDEMVFALEHGGHGGGYSPSLPAPFLESAPFPQSPAMRFRVSGTGSCLNVRAQPGVESESLACLLDGTLLELDLEGEVLLDGYPRLSALEWDGVPWTLVRGPGALRGWVSTDFLSWDA